MDSQILSQISSEENNKKIESESTSVLKQRIFRLNATP